MVYVTQNITQGVPPTSRYYNTFVTVQREISNDLMRMQWGPVQPLLRGLPRDPLVLDRARQIRKIQEQTVARAVVEYRALLHKQLTRIAEEQAKQSDLLHGILYDISKEEPAGVERRLRDQEPLVRWLAVQVVSKKRLPLEKDLVDLLADEHREVRQAAHQALVRLSRGSDFGPAPNATTQQLQKAQQRWRQWLERQTAPEDVAEALP